MRRGLVMVALFVASSAQAAAPLLAMDQAATVGLVRDATGGLIHGGGAASVLTAGFGMVASADQVEVQDRKTGQTTIWRAVDLVDPKVGVSFGDRVTLAAGAGAGTDSLTVLVVHAGQSGDFRGLLLHRTDASGALKLVRSVAASEFAPELAGWLGPSPPCPNGGCAYGDKLSDSRAGGSRTRDIALRRATRDRLCRGQRRSRGAAADAAGGAGGDSGGSHRAVAWLGSGLRVRSQRGDLGARAAWPGQPTGASGSSPTGGSSTSPSRARASRGRRCAMSSSSARTGTR
jgi:hypothetical protein